ncbi:MAG: slipin family protein [Spirochaetaceae bacterium]|jgi:regulator of protease activity HflC (stomatin/prohibitin superfamily)|nr:slipin family protein [Spirochaetaceae bacterium]
MKKTENRYIINVRKRRRSNIVAFTGYCLFFAAVALAVLQGMGMVADGLPTDKGREALSYGVFFALSLLLISIRRALEWERMVVLRFGKFRAVKGPGLFWVIPFIDKIAHVIDIRLRVTDFSAQGTLTRDSVTVTVDALCFWLVWDPQKAALEVEDYEEAVVFSAKTALRSAISSHDLSTFLEHGEAITKSLQQEVDKKTTDWGITILYIEIHDVQIPEPLQDSLSRLAQAEREKKARILLADAEIEIAKRLEEAVTVYAKNGDAMKLKILSILNEGLKAGNSMMLVPNSLTEELKTKDIFGLQALNEIKNKG